ncbi:hypothetical protein [Streptomyces sp. NBC_01615]|uniref:hypothetical protein n=1 Tax=Streptomyces sp. NBC_01615 TaxID=2975898 RepID=UPI003867CDAA
MAQEYGYRWGHSGLTADFDLDGDTPRLVRLARPGDHDLKGAVEAALPLGLPGWTDEWVALGLRAPVAGATYLTVWRRGGGVAELLLPVPHLAGLGDARVEVLHPSTAAPGAGRAEWKGKGVRVRLGEAPAVLLVRITAGD